MKTGVGGIPWMAVGAAGFAIFLLAMIYVRRGQDTAAQVAFKARRADVVAAMQRDLALTSEVEKAAASAATSRESRALAERARAASGRVDDERRDLADLLSGSDQTENARLSEFTSAFAELERVDADLLVAPLQNADVRSLSMSVDRKRTAMAACEEALRALHDAIQAEPIAGAPVRPR